MISPFLVADRNLVVARDPLSPRCQGLQDELNGVLKRIEIEHARLSTASPGNKAAIIDEIERLQHDAELLEKQLEDCVAGPVSNVRIIGAEYTQATQYFRSLLNPCPDLPATGGQCPDNEIPLVAGKDTVVRTYINVSQDAAFPAIAGLSGRLQVRKFGNPAWEAQLTPINAPVTPRRDSEIDRSAADHTLNFRIPGDLCEGLVQIEVTAFDAAHPGFPGFTSQSSLAFLSFRNTAPLKIRLVWIRYQNQARGFDLSAPSINDFWMTAQFSLRTYPIPEIVLVRDSEELYDGDFTSFFASGGPNARGTTGTVFEIIKALRLAEDLGSDVQYLAVIPSAPNQTGASGWAAGTRQSITEVFAGATMAQEIGHHCIGSFHAPCGGPNQDPNYPTYDNYPSGSIGEFGFNTVTSAVFNPAVAYDFMSYCSPVWVSPYMYRRLFSCYAQAAANQIFGAAEFVSNPRKHLDLLLTIYRNCKIEIHGTPKLIDATPRVPTGVDTPYFIELRDNDDRILRAQRLLLSDAHVDLEAGPLDFAVEIPWSDATSHIVVCKGCEELTTIKVGEAPPNVTVVSPKKGHKLGGVQRVEWQIDGGADGVKSFVRYSHDGGRLWQHLASELSKTWLEVNVDLLPSGEEAFFEVLAVRGIQTATARSATFVVSPQDCQVGIVVPEDGASFIESSSVHLFGFAHSPEGSVGSDTLLWTSDVDGRIGIGQDLVTHQLSVGTHRITVSAPDACGSATDTRLIHIRQRDFRVFRPGELVAASQL